MNRRNMVEILGEAGRAAGFCDVNAKTQDVVGTTALHLAAGQEGPVEELCEGVGREAGFSAIAAQDVVGNTALHHARTERQVETMLRAASRIGEEERHALVYAVAGFFQDTVLHRCIHHPSAVQGLIKFCSDAELDFLLHSRDNDGRNPLRFVASLLEPAAISTLLHGLQARGYKGRREFMEADREGDGLSALHVAIAFHYGARRPYAGVTCLLRPGGGGEGEEGYEGGVDVNGRCSKRTGECEMLVVAACRDQ
jgi:hypothetical protein